MSAKQVALDDMRKCGLDVSFFLYDIWFGDGRRYNGGYHPKKDANGANKSSCTMDVES